MLNSVAPQEDRSGRAQSLDLVRRAHDTRPAVLAVADALGAAVGDLGIGDPDAWLPADDPHRKQPPSRQGRPS